MDLLRTVEGLTVLPEQLQFDSSSNIDPKICLCNPASLSVVGFVRSGSALYPDVKLIAHSTALLLAIPKQNVSG